MEIIMGAYKLLTEEKTYLQMLKEKVSNESSFLISGGGGSGAGTGIKGAGGSSPKGPSAGAGTGIRGAGYPPLRREEEDETADADEKLLIDKPIADKDGDEKEKKEKEKVEEQKRQLAAKAKSSRPPGPWSR
jgi:hypothetical protein